MDALFYIETTKRCSSCGLIKVWIFSGRKLKDGTKIGIGKCGRRWDGARCPDCKTEYHKQYYEDNKEWLSEYHKQYYEDNRDAKLEYAQLYREDHKEEIAEYKKQYAIDHKEEIAEYAKQYREDHKDWYKEYMKQYGVEYRQRPEVKATHRNRIAIRKLQIQNTDDGSINAVSLGYLRYYVQQNLCPYCDVNLDDVEIHLDHTIPLSRSGTHTIDNVKFTCEPCNLGKNDKLLSEWRS